MKDITLVINSDLDVLWIDRGDGVENNAPTRGFTEYIEPNRNCTKFVRWAMGKVSEDYNGVVTVYGEKSFIQARRLGKFITLNITTAQNELVRKDIEYGSGFWNVFTRTFPGGLLLLDQQHKTIQVSETFISILDVKDTNGVKISSNSFVGENINDIFFNIDKLFTEECRLRLNHAVSANENDQFDTQINSKHVRVFVSPIYDGPNYLGSCIYLFDVSKEVETNLIVEKQKTQLFQNSKLTALGEMAGGIAHEINNPLAIIMTKTMLLQKKIQMGRITEPELINDLQHTLGTVKRMSDIIDSMRSLYRDTDKDELQIHKIRSVVTDVSMVTADRCRYKKIYYEFNIEEGLLNQNIECCKGQVGQVLLSLLNNSIDAIEEQGSIKSHRIVLSAFSRDDNLIFQVRDTAGGLNKEVVEKIFQPFFTTKEIGKGPGLGLSLSAKIVNNHNGRLDIHRYDKDETVFQFNIPVNYTG
jgi:signal transduction histidine kinase